MTQRAGSAFLAVSELIDREVALDELLRTLIRRIARAMEADRGTLFLVDRARAELFSKVAELPELPEIRIQLGQGVAGHVALTGETVNVPTTQSEARFFKGVDARTGYRTESILAVPMRDAAGELIGVVQLLNKAGGVFTRDDEVTTSALAAQAGAAIEATTLYEALFRGAPAQGQAQPVADQFNRIIGDSAPMREAYRLTTRAAASEATVLLRGESGTGKELFARAVHVNSGRRDGPLVKVDCAALPVSLIENELFGHERGAYTGADQRALGKVDAAQQGTLFLDEIGELPLAAQGKLLRLLQDREFDRVGGTRPVKADVRVVAATNRELERLVAEGRFRADLYYRIRVVEIRLPPLRARGRDDLARLVRHFAITAARRHGRPVPTLSEPAWARINGYAWPGNVRELENCLESAVVVSESSVLGPEDLPLPRRTPAEQAPASAFESAPPLDPEGLRPLAAVEREHILSVLAQVGGNRSEAARHLGIGRNTLARKLREYGA